MKNIARNIVVDNVLNVTEEVDVDIDAIIFEDEIELPDSEDPTEILDSFPFDLLEKW